MKNIQALVLAAGKGTRIGAADKPKVLFELNKKPLIDCVLKNLNEAGFKKPILVIGFQGNLVQDYLKNRAEYVWQKRQLGTGHAVLSAKNAAKNYQNLLITYGDMPFWHSQTYKDLINLHQKTKATLSLVTVIFDDPELFKYGRIIRDKAGNLLKSVEEKEATEKEKKIKECNPCLYVVNTDWLYKNLPKLKKQANGEYYLTDILELAINQKQKIATLHIVDWKQAIGINTKEHLELAGKILSKSK